MKLKYGLVRCLNGQIIVCHPSTNQNLKHNCFDLSILQGAWNDNTWWCLNNHIFLIYLQLCSFFFSYSKGAVLLSKADAALPVERTLHPLPWGCIVAVSALESAVSEISQYW